MVKKQLKIRLINLESFSFFNETYFYVVESDSNDNTVKILKNFKKS